MDDIKKAVVVLSGGMDSATALYQAKADGFNIYAISFDYGQRHKKELDFAASLAKAAGVVEHHIVDLTSITQLISNSSLTNKDIAGVGVTGSARYLIAAMVNADIVKNEITAHAIAALPPSTRRCSSPTAILPSASSTCTVT